MILYESVCLEPLSFKSFSTPTCCSFKMAAAQGEHRFFAVECDCGKIISVKMLSGEFSAKAEEDIKLRLKQHAYSLKDKGHVKLKWDDVVEMPIWSYDLEWEDKVEVLLSQPPRAPSQHSSDDESIPPKRARLEEGHSLPASSPRPFSQLDRDEKLNKLNMILERVESKLDEVKESVARL